MNALSTQGGQVLILRRTIAIPNPHQRQKHLMRLHIFQDIDSLVLWDAVAFDILSSNYSENQPEVSSP